MKRIRDVEVQCSIENRSLLFAKNANIYGDFLGLRLRGRRSEDSENKVSLMVGKGGNPPMIIPNCTEAKLMKVEPRQSIEGNASSETREEYRRICAELGLQPDFLTELDEIPRESRHHRKLSDWIEIFLEDSTESVKKDDKYSLTKELLGSIGFDPTSKAVKTIMARAFSGSMQEHIEASEWAQLFIKDEFKDNPLLSPKTSKFPFQSDVKNTWFQLSKEEYESDEDITKVRIINLETKKSESHIKTMTLLRDFVAQDDKNGFLFHGTDHKSAKQILMQGIYLYAGREKRDFSCGDGFYLTNKMEHALNWAKSTTARPAILIFQVKREDMDNARRLNLNKNKEKWKEIVSCFRTGKRTAKVRKSLTSYDFIEGPMSVLTKHETTDEVVFEPKCSSYQMCLISEDFAERFEKNLHSIVFLGNS